VKLVPGATVLPEGGVTSSDTTDGMLVGALPGDVVEADVSLEHAILARINAPAAIAPVTMAIGFRLAAFMAPSS
jgi:hypothetical protein